MSLFWSLYPGWGRISGQSNQAAYELQQTSLPVVDHDTCYRKNGYYVHETSMVCAGASGSSVCNGDSGGPLVCEENGKWVLRGVTSWVTSKACPTMTYSVYARVGSYVDWVKGKMGKKWNFALLSLILKNTQYFCCGYNAQTTNISWERRPFHVTWRADYSGVNEVRKIGIYGTKMCIIVHSTHYLFSVWRKFKRTMNFRNQRLGCHLAADYTIIMWGSLKVTGNHVIYDRGAWFRVRVIMSSSRALCCLPSVKKQKHDF